jgi:hypothetical protein
MVGQRRGKKVSDLFPKTSSKVSNEPEKVEA